MINVAANNISTGGALDAGIISFGSTIGGNATVNVTAANITTGGVFLSRILNEIGASIGGDAAINLTANTLSVGNLSSSIENFDGSINGSANINFNLTGDLTTQGDAGIGSRAPPAERSARTPRRTSPRITFRPAASLRYYHKSSERHHRPGCRGQCKRGQHFNGRHS